MGFTIKQIASIAGVSTATVSLAMNNKPGISPLTRNRILKIIESLQKESGVSSFSDMVKGSVRFLKIVKHGHIVNRDHDVFIGSYIDGMDQEARKRGYNLEITAITANEIGNFMAHLSNALAKGLIVLGTELNAKEILAFEALKIPVVVVDAAYDFIGLDFVDMNNMESVFKIVRHFVDNNHRDIGFLWSEVEACNFAMRIAAFEKALRYHDLPYNSKYLYKLDSTFDGAYQGMLEILRRGQKLPTALFSINDLIASACIKAVKEVGLRIPGDLSIVGFDNLPICSMLDPPLTTMDVSKKQIGQTAMRLVIDRIESVPHPPSFKISIGGELVVRESVRKLPDVPRT